jgi:hypothetical protein
MACLDFLLRITYGLNVHCSMNIARILFSRHL